MLNRVFFNLSLTGIRSCAEIHVSAACWLACKRTSQVHYQWGKDAAATLVFLSAEEFDSIVVPAKMTGPQKPDIDKPGRTGKS
jgi:hypothetical protein